MGIHCPLPISGGQGDHSKLRDGMFPRPKDSRSGGPISGRGGSQQKLRRCMYARSKDIRFPSATGGPEGAPFRLPWCTGMPFVPDLNSCRSGSKGTTKVVRRPGIDKLLLIDCRLQHRHVEMKVWLDSSAVVGWQMKNNNIVD